MIGGADKGPSWTLPMIRADGEMFARRATLLTPERCSQGISAATNNTNIYSTSSLIRIEILKMLFTVEYIL
jgi:hypothetical protein